MVESIPGTSHHHFRTKLITSSITLFMLRTTNQAAIWKHLFVSICDRKDWAVIYFDAVHRCSTDRNVHISTDEFRKKKLNGGYSLTGFPVIHLMQYTYPVNTVDTALIQIFRTHGQRNSGIPEMSELIYWHIRLILAWPSCWTIIHLGMYQTNLSHFQNYPKDLGVSRGMELRDLGHYQFGKTA